MNRNPLLTSYISEIDQFLQEIAQKNPRLSRSQLEEMAKDQWQALGQEKKRHEKTS